MIFIIGGAIIAFILAILYKNKKLPFQKSDQDTARFIIDTYYYDASLIAPQYGVGVETALAVIMQETHGELNREVGAAGERGLMQVTPGALSDGNSAFPPALSLDDLFTVHGGITAGCRYLAIQLRKYGNERNALSAYNSGDVDQKGLSYADSVLQHKTLIHSLL